MNTNQFIPLSTLAQNLQNTHHTELVPGKWKEGQLVLLHENKAISKIDSACDIINAVNQHDATREILYIDTENHASALVEQLAENTHLSVYRPTFDDDTLDKDYADLVISAIETAVKETQIRVFAVDSINRIAAASFGRNASPVHIMKKLVALQMRYGISLLVIAHTDSRSTREALLALSDRDYYAQIKPRPLKKSTQHTPSPTPQHTPSKSQEQIRKDSSTAAACRGGRELLSNHRPRQCESKDAGDSVASLLGHDLRSKAAGDKSARYHQQSNSQVPSSTKDNPSDSSERSDS